MDFANILVVNLYILNFVLVNDIDVVFPFKKTLVCFLLSLITKVHKLLGGGDGKVGK